MYVFFIFLTDKIAMLSPPVLHLDLCAPGVIISGMEAGVPLDQLTGGLQICKVAQIPYSISKSTRSRQMHTSVPSPGTE